MDPAGKVALVTGGADGLGFAFCEELLIQEVKGVSICDVNSKLGEQRTRELQQKYGESRIIFIKTDVRDYKQFEEAFKKTKENFGELHIVVNNAGIFDDVQWEKEVDINLNGIIRGLLLSFDHMGKRSGSVEPAVVVNISSITGLEPLDTIPIYSGIKHGILGLTRAFGTTLHLDRTGVRVVALCPGFTLSNIGPKEGTVIDKAWEDFKSPFQEQTADYVGRSLLKLIRTAPNGSIWVSEEEQEAYQTVLPPKLSMKVDKT